MPRVGSDRGLRNGPGRGSPDRRWPLPPFRADGAAGEVGRLVAAGEVRPVLLDVHAPAGAALTFSVRLAALRLLLPERLAAAGAVVCLDTAVWLYAGGQAPARVDVALPGGRGRSAGIVRVHALGYGAADLWAALPGFAVTSPARTAADAARALPPADAVCVLAALGVTAGVRPDHVAAVLARLAGRPGVARARRALGDWQALWPGAAVPVSEARLGQRSVDPVAGDPVRVEDALDPAHGADDVVEVAGGGHLEGEPRDRDAVA
jgi:hypothetical protein